MCRVGTGVYFDGMNLFYGALKGTRHKWLNLSELAKILNEGTEPCVTRYFTARVKSRPGQPRAQQHQDAYLRALVAHGGVHIHEGFMQYRYSWKPLAHPRLPVEGLFVPSMRPKWMLQLLWPRVNGIVLAAVEISEEKRSDVNMAVHMIRDVATGLVDHVVMVSNDADLTEAAIVVRQLGAKVTLVNPRPNEPSKYLKREVDAVRPFPRDHLDRCRLPLTVPRVGGRAVRCPREWT